MAFSFLMKIIAIKTELIIMDEAPVNLFAYQLHA